MLPDARGTGKSGHDRPRAARGAQHGTAAEPAVRLTPPCGSPSTVVQRAVALVQYPVFNPVFFGTGGDGRATRWRT